MRGPPLDYASKEVSKPPTGGLKRLIVAAMVCLLTLTLIMILSPDPQAAGWIMRTGVPATIIILGVIARQNIANSAPRRRGGTIVVFLVLVLAVVLVCGLLVRGISEDQARRHARALRIECASNLRQIGLAMLMYANANSGLFPPTLDLLLTVPDSNAQLTPDVFICPTDSRTLAAGPTAEEAARRFRVEPGHSSYIYVGAGLTNAAASDQILAFEDPRNHDHHGKGVNVLFGDGHVEYVEKPDTLKRIAQIAAPQPSFNGK